MIPALFFTADIQHAHDLSAVLRHHGVRVYPVSGKTPTGERQRLVRLAREGKIDGLASCDALTVGTDIPIAMLAAMTKPTTSGLWYRQAVGRVFRRYPTPAGERPCQRAALVNIYRALQRGVLSQLIVMPTGVGKTVVAAKSPAMIQGWKQRSNLPLRGRIWFSVHRDELAQQAADTFARFNPTLKIGIEKADSYAGDADVVIASVQTVGANKGKRLKPFDPFQFDAGFTDEAHWGVNSALYEHLYKHFRVWKTGPRDPQMLHVGMTATPNRADNVGLEKHYDEITYVYALLDAIKDGWLSSVVAHRVETSVDISKVPVRGEDFVTGELEKEINTRTRNELVAQKYLEVCHMEGMDGEGWTPPADWVKPHAVVLDFADLSGKHSLISAPTLFGFPARYNPKGADLVRAAEHVKEIQEQHPNLDLRDAPDMDYIHAKLHSVDLLAPPVVPPEVQQRSQYAWLPDGPGSYHLGLTDHRVLTVRQNVLGQWEIHEHKNGIANHLWNAKNFPEALRLAEKQMPPRDAQMLNSKASWMNDGPTMRQTQLVWDLDVRVRRQFRTPDSYYEYCRRQFRAGDGRFNKGGLSRMIDALDPSNALSGPS